MTLSIEQQKLHKKAVSDLARKVKSITVKWQVGQLHSWAEVYNFTTVPPGSTAEHLNSKPTWSQLKEYFNELSRGLESKYQTLGESAPELQVATGISEASINRPEESTSQIQIKTKEDGGRDPGEVNKGITTDLLIDESKDTSIVIAPTSRELTPETRNQPPSKSEPTKDEDYGLVSSPNEKVFLFWFQKKATAELLNGILGFDAAPFKTTTKLKEYIATLSSGWRAAARKRCQLLLAGTGTGKTFICGALLRRLVDINFSDGKTYGHIPYLYVTRATVVEQTQRVFSKFFGLTIRDGVEVLNIEQLRAKAGQLWIKEETIVQNGKEVVMYKWKKFQQPCVIILDECQSVKNEGTTQSEIVQAFADCMPEQTFCVFVSATPFTKVAEAKSFVMNCCLEDKEI